MTGKPLHATKAAAIGGGMKPKVIAACLGCALLVAACRKSAEVSVTDERPLTLRDANPVLDANSNERFRPDAGGPFLAGVLPPGWQEMPPSQFRLLSYRFGHGGDVAVGVAAGGLVENVNRWLGQFGAEPLTPDQVDGLEKGTVVGVEGVWVEATGDYSPGMGQPELSDQALYGLIAEDSGEIITVKMTGPADEVAAQKEPLRTFVAGLRRRAE